MKHDNVAGKIGNSRVKMVGFKFLALLFIILGKLCISMPVLLLISGDSSTLKRAVVTGKELISMKSLE